MDIMNSEKASDDSLLKLKIGNAALVFEKVEDWKNHFQNLVVRWDIQQLTCNLQLEACKAVWKNRLPNKYHLGDIFYTSLVSSS